MLLSEISPNDPLTNLALAGLVSRAPVLNDMQFYARPGSADRVKSSREGTTAATYFRSLNETPNTSTAATPVYQTPLKKIVSYDAKVDRILQHRQEPIEDELAYQVQLESEEAGWILQEKFFEGDDAANAEEFDGLKNLVDATWIKPTAANGIVLQLGNSDDAVAAQQVAVEELLKLFATVRGGASHAYMNEYLKIRWISIAKALGYYRQSKDELGNLIEQIGSTIIRGAGFKKDGTAILPFTETLGGATNCSSIYAVRWGERTDLTALTSIGLKVEMPVQSGNLIIANANMDMTLVLQNVTALVKSTGWRLATS
jgi:hypothetical protein